MEELDVNNSLLKEDLFELFIIQLKKDFEGAGAGGTFTEDLPRDFDALKNCITLQLDPILANNFSLISSLLYRIDISEAQIKGYEQKNSSLPFNGLLAELIIKRILQKIILRKTFSK